MNLIIGALKSKTIWVSILTILLGALADPVQAWISAHPGGAATVVGLVMAGLRLVTNQSLAAKGTPAA